MTQMNRRRFLKTSCAALAAWPAAACVARPIPVRSPYASAIPDEETGTVVNDVHSQLNRTRVGTIVRPRSVEELHEAVAHALAGHFDHTLDGLFACAHLGGHLHQAALGPDDGVDVEERS
jgi:hypothetical protein